MANLGLIAGLGPGATLYYYEKLAKLPANEMLLIQADMTFVRGCVERGDRVVLADYFARLIERMARGGADFATISAIAPHMCIRELEKITPLPLINIIEEVKKEVHARGYKRIAMFGTKYVAASKMYGMLDDVEVVVPEQVEQIHTAYLQLVDGDLEVKRLLTSIAKQLPVDAVLLAGTDLSQVFDESNTEFPCMDCAAVHIRAIEARIKAPRVETQ